MNESLEYLKRHDISSDKLVSLAEQHINRYQRILEKAVNAIPSECNHLIRVWSEVKENPYLDALKEVHHIEIFDALFDEGFFDDK